MATITRSTYIAGSRDDVWAKLSDFASIAAWAPNVGHSCLLSDQVDDVGAVRRTQVGRNTMVETVQVWDPPVTLGYRIEGLPPVLTSVTNTWTLEADGAGTVATLTSEIEAGSRPPQKVIARAVGRILGAASVQMLDGLRDAIATQGATRDRS